MNKYLAGACIILLLLLVAIGCHMCSGPKVETTVLHDTTYVHDLDSNDYTPQIVSVMGGQIPPEVKGKVQTIVVRDTIEKERLDTLYVYERDVVDSLLSSYYATNYYSDTQRTKYGNVVIGDSVSENKIKRRNLVYDFSLPEVKTTEHVTEPSKVKGYVTASVLFNRYNGLQSVGVGGMLQFKNDNALEVGAFINKVVPLPNWSTTDFLLSYKHKISFTKK